MNAKPLDFHFAHVCIGFGHVAAEIPGERALPFSVACPLVHLSKDRRTYFFLQALKKRLELWERRLERD